MTDTAPPTVLILSARNAGGVRSLARLVRKYGLSPVLASSEARDLNADACDRHVLVNWDSARPEEVVAELARAGIRPVLVLTQVDSLHGWRLDLAERLGQPAPQGPDLGDKATVRGLMRSLGLSRLPSLAGTARAIDPAEVTWYPVIVKPSRHSGASRLVRRIDDEAALVGRLAELRSAAPELELVVEPYLEGIEFSVDGPVVGGRFHGRVVFEKVDHDDVRHHDRGLLLSPPPSPSVRSAARRLTADVSRLCEESAVEEGWLHVEGRVDGAGTVELIEVNPRPGGGLYAEACRILIDVDPDAWLVERAIEQATQGADPVPPVPGREPDGSTSLGLLGLEADELGVVHVHTGRDELLRIPGVVDVLLLDGYRVTDLDQENFFLDVLMQAPDAVAMNDVRASVLATLRTTITPHPR